VPLIGYMHAAEIEMENKRKEQEIREQEKKNEVAMPSQAKPSQLSALLFSDRAESRFNQVIGTTY
jgi:hypothetical protein